MTGKALFIRCSYSPSRTEIMVRPKELALRQMCSQLYHPQPLSNTSCQDMNRSLSEQKTLEGTFRQKKGAQGQIKQLLRNILSSRANHSRLLFWLEAYQLQIPLPKAESQERAEIVCVGHVPRTHPGRFALSWREAGNFLLRGRHDALYSSST
jgi:hypothetical protein